MSTSKTEWTWADVRLDSTMCSAIFFRIGVIATRCSLDPGANAGPGGAAGTPVA